MLQLLVLLIMNNKQSNIYTFAALFLVLIIDAMGIGLVVPLIGPLFISRTSGFVSMTMPLAERDLLYGITLASFCVFMFFGAPFLGDLSDHIGRKKVLLLCLFGAAVGLAISAIGTNIDSIFLLIAGRSIAGFMSGSQALAQAAIIDISTEKNKTTNLSLISFASCFGFVLGPILSGITADKHLWSGFGFSTPFWIAAIFAIINGSLLLITFHETFYPKAKQKLHLTKGAAIFISAITNKTVKKLSIAFLLAETGFGLYFQLLPLYLMKVFDFSTAQISHMMSWIGAMFGITLLLIVRIINRYMKIEKITVASLILTSLGILMILLKTEWIVWISVIPITIGGGLFYVALLTLFSNTVGEDSQGWVMGVFAAVMAVSWALSGVFSGVLEIFGLLTPFVVASGSLLISTIFCF